MTHDRYLMNSLGCPILYLEDGGAARYDSYDALMHRGAPAQAEEPAKKDPAKPAYGKEQRRRRAQLRETVKALEDRAGGAGHQDHRPGG